MNIQIAANHFLAGLVQRICRSPTKSFRNRRACDLAVADFAIAVVVLLGASKLQPSTLDMKVESPWINISDELPEQFDPSRCVSPGPPQTPAFLLRPTALVPVRLDRS